MSTPLSAKVDVKSKVAEGEPLMNTNTRREFLSLTLKGATMVAATGFLAKAVAASDTADIAGSTGTAQTLGSNGKWHYKPPFRFGMGVFRLAMNSRLSPTRTPTPRSKRHGTLASDTTTWLRGTDWVWLSAATATSCITRSGANTFFPRRWASCLRPRKLRKIKSTSLFLLHPTM